MINPSLLKKNGSKTVCKEPQDLTKGALVIHTSHALLSGGRSPHTKACKSTIIFLKTIIRTRHLISTNNLQLKVVHHDWIKNYISTHTKE